HRRRLGLRSHRYIRGRWWGRPWRLALWDAAHARGRQRGFMRRRLRAARWRRRGRRPGRGRRRHRRCLDGRRGRGRGLGLASRFWSVQRRARHYLRWHGHILIVVVDIFGVGAVGREAVAQLLSLGGTQSIGRWRWYGRQIWIGLLAALLKILRVAS